MLIKGKDHWHLELYFKTQDGIQYTKFRPEFHQILQDFRLSSILPKSSVSFALDPEIIVSGFLSPAVSFPLYLSPHISVPLYLWPHLSIPPYLSPHICIPLSLHTSLSLSISLHTYLSLSTHQAGREADQIAAVLFPATEVASLSLIFLFPTFHTPPQFTTWEKSPTVKKKRKKIEKSQSAKCLNTEEYESIEKLKFLFLLTI